MKKFYFLIGLLICYLIPGCTRPIETAKAADIDSDGLTNDEEQKYGTDPKNPDTDNDGLKDGDEVLKYGSSPVDIDIDTDNDGWL